ncbi:MAG: hypothetical protein CFE26_14275 [Verrucomicrobiales bacterium VVV1]|nr:MAG: hypothetical protein CFE26_14275 [Verrucomicrobiales bacterium VVV1]
MTSFPFPAAIPVLDWHGPAFLTFYGVAFLLAMGLSLSRSASMRKRFELPGSRKELTDPYEAAYLAGGPPRVVQLAVARLLKLGLVEWKSSWPGGRLIATGAPAPAGGLRSIEVSILTRALGQKKGLVLTEIGQALSSKLTALEARLASAGLRPMSQEVQGQGMKVCLPMFTVMAIGVVKLVIGLSRDRPVGFLVIALFVSLVILLIIGSSHARRTGLLTASGRETLEHMRTRQSISSHPGLDAWSMGVALMGPMAMTGLLEHQDIISQLTGLQRNSSSGGGCGTSSGCGSSGCGSGCGGGGCGGCGGGGD